MEIKSNSGLFILAKEYEQNEISTTVEANETLDTFFTCHTTSQLKVKKKVER